MPVCSALLGGGAASDRVSAAQPALRAALSIVNSARPARCPAPAPPPHMIVNLPRPRPGRRGALAAVHLSQVPAHDVSAAAAALRGAAQPRHARRPAHRERASEARSTDTRAPRSTDTHAPRDRLGETDHPPARQEALPVNLAVWWAGAAEPCVRRCCLCVGRASIAQATLAQRVVFQMLPDIHLPVVRPDLLGTRVCAAAPTWRPQDRLTCGVATVAVQAPGGESAHVASISVRRQPCIATRAPLHPE
jgi:hypothetical protein